MKKVLLVMALLAFFAAGNIVKAQTIQAKDVTVKIDKAERPAISVTSEADIKKIQDEWASYLKKNYKVKTKTSKDEVFAEAASIPEISSVSFDLRATFKSDKDGCEMIVTAAAGYDLYFSPKDHREDYEKLKAVVLDFVRTFVAAQYDDMIRDKQKEIDETVKAKEDKEKEIAKLEKDIENANQTIEKLKKEIEENTATVASDKTALPNIQSDIDKKNNELKDLQSKKTNATGK